MTSSTTVSSMLFLLLLVFLLRVDESLGAQTEIRKLKEAIKVRRKLEDNNYKNSKMWTGPSESPHCQRWFKKMMITNDYSGDDYYSCKNCPPGYSYCEQCTFTKYCESYNGSPPSCRYNKHCCFIHQ